LNYIKKKVWKMKQNRRTRSLVCADNDIATCMLLYLLKVLEQTGQENWVGPMRIWEGVGIQYCPLLSLLLTMNPEQESSLPCSLSVIVISEELLEEESTEAISAALGFGKPMWSATVTVVVLLLPSSSLSSKSMAVQGRSWISTSCSCWSSSYFSCFVGIRLKRGSSSLRGGEGGEEEEIWW